MRTRDLEGRWYDVFADWDAADQAAALKVLEALQRQKVRDAEALQRQKVREAAIAAKIKAAEGPLAEALTRGAYSELGGPGPEDQNK